MTNPSNSFDHMDELRRIKEGFEPHNLSKKICEAIKNQKDIDEAIRGVMNTALKDSVETRSHEKE